MKDKRVQISVAHHEAMLAIKEQTGASVTFQVRQAIAEYVNKHSNRKKESK